MLSKKVQGKPCIKATRLVFTFLCALMHPYSLLNQVNNLTSVFLERFSFECRKVIGFAFTTLCDWFKKLAPLFHPIRSKTKTNRDSLVRVFPHFASTTCNYFVFWLVHLIICVLCDWLEWLLWFWFCDTQLKTTLCVCPVIDHTFHHHIVKLAVDPQGDCFFTITNCQISCSRSLTRRMNFKFMCLSANWP